MEERLLEEVSESNTDQCAANLLWTFTHRYLHAIPVPLCTLFLIGKVKARHTNDIKERLPNNPGRRVIDFPQTVFQPAGWEKKNNNPVSCEILFLSLLLIYNNKLEYRFYSRIITVTMADGVPLEIGVAIL